MKLTDVFSLLLLLTGLSILDASALVPSFTPIGLRQFSNGTNFTNILLIDESLFVGAK